jgi:thiamine biosynthesis lipoprotein
MRLGAAILLVFGLAACRDQPAPTAPPWETSATPPSGASATPASAAPGAAPSAAPVATAAAFTPERVWAEGKAMGTHVAFAAYTTQAVDAAKAREAFDLALAELRRVEALMTTWRPDSAVSQINAAAGAVGDETLHIIQESLHVSDISSGTFDITFQTLHGLWKFDEDLDPHPPTERDVKARLPFVGYRNVVLDEAKKTVMLKKERTQIGLGGIAKGYGVDQAVKVLEKAGLTSFFVQAGGDLFARGKKPDGSDWTAGIRDPRGKSSEEFFAVLPISDHAFSTAGDYERSYVVGGRRYHHIIDPRTGFPATASRSVTIWAPTALLADEIDDAAFILGPEKGLALVESLDGVGAVIVDAKNNVWVSKRLQGKLQITRPPTDAL